jgi:hypothetical protein
MDNNQSESEISKKMATATVEKKAHEAIPYIKIAKLYGEGLSYLQIAKKINRYNEGSPDPTKSTRAIVSRMHTDGYLNENNKIVKLKKRPGSRGMGVTKAVGKVTKAVGKVTKAVGKVTTTKVIGKAIAIMVTGDGKHVKIMVPSLITLVPIEVFETKVSKVLDAISDAHIAAENEASEVQPVPTVVVAEENLSEAPVSEVKAEVAEDQNLESALEQPFDKEAAISEGQDDLIEVDIAEDPNLPEDEEIQIAGGEDEDDNEASLDEVNVDELEASVPELA